MDQDQLEWLRTHQITRCPSSPEVGIPFRHGTERDLISHFATMGKSLDMNAETSLTPQIEGEAKHRKQRKQMAKTFFDEEKDAKLRQLHAAGKRDGEIGIELGCSGVTVCHRRKILGLPTKWGGKTGHNDTAPRPKMQRKAARRLVNPFRENTPPSNLVTISVTEERLDRWWRSLDLAAKGKVFESGT